MKYTAKKAKKNLANALSISRTFFSPSLRFLRGVYPHGPSERARARAITVCYWLSCRGHYHKFSLSLSLSHALSPLLSPSLVRKRAKTRGQLGGGADRTLRFYGARRLMRPEYRSNCLPLDSIFSLSLARSLARFRILRAAPPLLPSAALASLIYCYIAIYWGEKARPSLFEMRREKKEKEGEIYRMYGVFRVKNIERGI